MKVFFVFVLITFSVFSNNLLAQANGNMELKLNRLKSGVLYWTSTVDGEDQVTINLRIDASLANATTIKIGSLIIKDVPSSDYTCTSSFPFEMSTDKSQNIVIYFKNTNHNGKQLEFILKVFEFKDNIGKTISFKATLPKVEQVVEVVEDTPVELDITRLLNEIGSYHTRYNAIKSEINNNNFASVIESTDNASELNDLKNNELSGLKTDLQRLRQDFNNEFSEFAAAKEFKEFLMKIDSDLYRLSTYESQINEILSKEDGVDFGKLLNIEQAIDEDYLSCLELRKQLDENFSQLNDILSRTAEDLDEDKKIALTKELETIEEELSTIENALSSYQSNHNANFNDYEDFKSKNGFGSSGAESNHEMLLSEYSSMENILSSANDNLKTCKQNLGTSTSNVNYLLIVIIISVLAIGGFVVKKVLDNKKEKERNKINVDFTEGQKKSSSNTVVEDDPEISIAETDDSSFDLEEGDGDISFTETTDDEDDLNI